MKSLTVRLPEPLVADIEAESRGRKISKSDVVRERLERAPRQRRRTASLPPIADLIGSGGGPPPGSTCEAVLSEAFYLLGKLGTPNLGALLRRDAVRVAFTLTENLEPVVK